MKISKDKILIILLIILTVPTFLRMLRSGIFSMHDFHLFRMFEFNKCIQVLQIPCRWAPDSSLEYGQPLFNFYGQIVYIIGEPFHLLGLQIIDTVKLLFILSLAGSALAMFFLAKQIWGSSLSGVFAAALYVYAPYRAVDIWVRGALPEAFSFVWFPLIVFFFNKYVQKEKLQDLLLFSLFMAVLLLTHNLSFLMFLVFLGIWCIYFLVVNKKLFLFKNFAGAFLLIVSLSAFYLLPLVFEKDLITLGQTTGGYYNFRAHFTTLNQLLISRVWGYGASLWGPVDDLSLSAGHVHWVLSLIILSFATWQFFKIRKLTNLLSAIYCLVILDWFVLFLTHGRSAFIWERVSFLAFIQFPWRFLSIAAFTLSLTGGALAVLLKPKVGTPLIILLIFTVAVWNFQFFKEDLWFYTSDREQFSGETWRWHTSSAMNDFWPKYASGIPTERAPSLPVFLEGSGEVLEFSKTSKSISAQLAVTSKEATVQMPSVYFDGWKGFIDGQPLQIYPEGNYGQITMKIENGKRHVILQFTNTPVRTFGNVVSLTSLGIFGFLLLKRK